MMQKARPLFFRTFCLAILAIFWGSGLQAQAPPPQKTTNGWKMAPYGRLHVMVVFAEIEFDSTFGKLDRCPPEGTWLWKKGERPTWKDKLFSRDPNGEGHMTKYFRQASFGKFEVTGDYLDTVLTVKITDVVNQRGDVVTQEAFGNNYYRRAMLRELNSIENPKFGAGSKMEDFDRWSFTGIGQPNLEQPNGKVDLVILIWRNIHVHNLNNMSGFVSPGSLGNMYGWNSDMYSIFRTQDFLPKHITRHEFSHMLYGGNNFHTANGGAGQRTFLSTIGGYSNMSGSDCYSKTWNAWDRERMGWKNPANQYALSTRCTASNEEVDGALVYGEPLCGDGIYRLRDFISHGDAIRIKLPHLPKGVRSQYLWLENHQREKGNLDHDKVLPKGLYAYLTVGRDVTEGNSVFSGPNNYLWPVIAHGNYDFKYDLDKDESIEILEERANPLTGYHYCMRITDDIDGDGKIRVTADMSKRTEYFLPSKLFVEGEEKPEEFFSYKTYPMFGTLETPFTVEGHNTISIASNPASTPVYTLQGGSERPTDNRRIYLNGLSVEVLRVDEQGDLYVRIRWDNFDIPNDVRWCGNILLNEQVNLTNNAEIRLEQGLSAQLATKVQEIDGKGIFAEPTILEVAEGAQLDLAGGTRLRVRKGATLLIRKGAKVKLGRDAGILVEDGAYLYVEQGAEFSLARRRAEIRLESGAQQGIHPILEDRFPDLGPQARNFMRN